MRLALLLLALTALPAAAQTRVGLGVRLSPADLSGNSFSDDAFFSQSAVSFLVPIDVRNVVRVEPILGYASSSVSQGGFDQTQRATTLGVTVSALVPAPGVTLTAGVRLRNTRLSLDASDTPFSTLDRVDALSVGPLVGGEYPFSDRFRIGAEAGLEYRSFSYGYTDNLLRDDGGRPDVSGVGTTAAVTVRFFLF